MANTSEELTSLRRQLAEAQENLRITREHKSKFIVETDIPPELTKNERGLKREIDELKRQSRPHRPHQRPLHHLPRPHPPYRP